MKRLGSFVVKVLISVLGVYALIVGGTFSGETLAEINKVNLLILSCGVLAWMYIRWRNDWQWANTSLNTVLAAGVIVVAIATIANLDSWRRIAIGLWYMGFYLALWLLLIDCLANGLATRLLIDGFIVISLVSLLFGYIEFYFWARLWLPVVQAGIPAPFAPTRVMSVAGNANLYGTILIVMILLGLGRFMQARRWAERMAWIAYLVVSGIILFITNSRGAMIGLACGLSVWVLLMMNQQGWLSITFLRKTWRQLSLVKRRIVVGSIIVSALLIVVMIPIVWQTVFLRPWSSYDITTGRARLWQIAVKETLENPLTGTGLFTFGKDLLQNQYSELPPHEHAHSLPLNISAELGFPGLLVLIVWCVVVTFLWWKNLKKARTTRQRYELIGIYGALAAFGGHHIIDTPITSSHMALIGMVLVLSAVADTFVVEHHRKYARVGLLIAGGLWATVLVTGWWSYTVKQNYENAIAVIERGDRRQGAELLEPVIALDPAMPIYPGMQGVAYGLAAYHGDQAAIDEGIVAFERALQVEGLYAPWWANLAALYWQAGDFDQAVETMEKALERAPKYDFLKFNLGLMYENTGAEQAAQTIYTNLLLQTKHKNLRYDLFWQETAVRRQALADSRANQDSSNDGNETIQMVLSLFEQGEYEAARDLLLAYPGTAGRYTMYRVLLALAYELLEDPTQADLWMQSARLYGGTTWLAVGDALLATWRDDPNAQDLLAIAQQQISPSERGWNVDMHVNYPRLQFFRAAIPEQYLPQLAYPSSPLEQQALELLLTFNL